MRHGPFGLRGGPLARDRDDLRHLLRSELRLPTCSLLVREQCMDEIVDVCALALARLGGTDRRLPVRPPPPPAANPLSVGAEFGGLVHVQTTVGAHEHDPSALSDVLRRCVRADQPLQRTALRHREDHLALGVSHVHLRWSGV